MNTFIQYFFIKLLNAQSFFNIQKYYGSIITFIDFSFAALPNTS